MCERPGVYLGLRRGDAAALAVAALALIVVPGSAGAAGTSVAHATDPSATADSLLFQRLGGPRGDQPRRARRFHSPGSHPAIGGPLRRHRPGRPVRLFDRNTPGADRPDPRARAPTRSRSRTAGSPIGRPPAGGDGIFIRYIANPAAPAPPLQVASQGGAGQLSRPAVDGNVLLFALATPRGSRVVQRAAGHAQAPRAGPLAEAPALRSLGEGPSFAYVRTDARRSRLMIRRRQAHGAGRVLFSLGRSEGSALVERAHRARAPTRRSCSRAPGIPTPRSSASAGKHPKRFQPARPRGGGNHRF